MTKRNSVIAARENAQAVNGNSNAAVLAERIRIAAILESPEGKRNTRMATELALRTSLDAETARSLLAAAPASNPFTEAMDRLGPVNVSADAVTISGDAKAARLKEIGEAAAAFNEARGFKKKA
jgi:hypothetical protein